MKRRFALPFFLFIVLLASCSTDKDEDNNDDEDAIVGTWYATELKLDSSAGSEAQFAKQILDWLTGDDCYIIKFTFNSDMSAVARNSVEYLDVNVNPDGSGLDIPCPSEEDTDEGTYTFEDNVLTIIDSEDQEITVDVVVDGDTMTFDASDLDIPNFSVDGQLVFERQ